MWDLTRDEALLKEAAEKFPNDPLVCLAMAGGGPSRNALPWIERLVESNSSKFPDLQRDPLVDLALGCRRQKLIECLLSLLKLIRVTHCHYSLSLSLSVFTAAFSPAPENWK